MNKLRQVRLRKIAEELQKQYELIGEIQQEEQEALDATPESFEDKIDTLQSNVDSLDNIIYNLDQVISDINDLV
jgi:phage-related protein